MRATLTLGPGAARAEHAASVPSCLWSQGAQVTSCPRSPRGDRTGRAEAQALPTPVVWAAGVSDFSGRPGRAHVGHGSVRVGAAPAGRSVATVSGESLRTRMLRRYSRCPGQDVPGMEMMVSLSSTRQWFHGRVRPHSVRTHACALTGKPQS